MAVRIVADTTAGLPLEFAAQHGIPILPQIVIFGEESYRDDCDLDTATFLKKLKAAATLPKTAAPPPALYVPIYKELVEAGHSVLVITPSADVSGTYRSALVGLEDFRNTHPEHAGADIRVWDCRILAGPMAELVQRAVAWAEAGDSMDAILTRLEEMKPKTRVFLMVDTLEYLQKGGRIGGAQALVGTLLQIKPILHVEDGRLGAGESQRTQRKAMARICELAVEAWQRGAQGLCVMHAAAEENAARLAADIQRQLGLPELPVYLLPPAIVVHAGPGVLAVGWIEP